MAWSRDTSNTQIGGSSLYAYTEVDWHVEPTRCSYTHIGGCTSPYSGWNTSPQATLYYREWRNGAWEEWTAYASGSARYYGSGDLELVRTTDSWQRQDDDREVQLDCDVYASTSTGSGTGSAWLYYVVPHKAPAVTWVETDPVVLSNGAISLTWNQPSRGYDSIRLEVSIDSGSWSEFVALNNSATSYQYTDIQDGHSYQFRIRTSYVGSYSAYDTCDTVISTIPTINATVRSVALGGTDARITVTNAQPVDASFLEYQLGTVDGEGMSWSSEVRVPSQSYTNVRTVFDVDMTTYTHIRVRFMNQQGSSSWTEPYEVVLAGRPEKPTWLAPTSPTVDKSVSLHLEWSYSNPDNSEQTRFRLIWYKNSTIQPQIEENTSNNYYDMQVSGLNVGDELSFRVQTAGVDGSLSTASELKNVTLYTAPVLNITSPADVVEGVPIEIAATYTDMEGYSCQSADVSLRKDGVELHSESALVLGSRITASIGVTEFIPTNQETYTVVLTARSSSGLKATANATFFVDFVEPPAGAVSVVNTVDDGYVSIRATFDNTGAEVPAVSISVARVNADNTTTPLITDGANGSGFVDKYAPLNTPYKYAVTTKAASGAVNTIYVENVFRTTFFYAYWGDNVAKARYNPSNSGIQVTRPQKTRVYYAGRKDPVSYDGAGVSFSESPSWMVIGRDERDKFVKLIEDGGRGVYKSGDGFVYHADFELTLNPSYTAIGYYGSVTLNVTRIAGEKL